MRLLSLTSVLTLACEPLEEVNGRANNGWPADRCATLNERNRVSMAVQDSPFHD
jgi:hypothetical protein